MKIFEFEFKTEGLYWFLLSCQNFHSWFKKNHPTSQDTSYGWLKMEIKVQQNNEMSPKCFKRKNPNLKIF